MKKTTLPVEIGGTDYETIAAGQAAQVLGAVGAMGDYLARLILNVTTVGTADVTITDGATAIVIQTGGAGLQTGARVVELGMRAKTGPWKVTTGAGVTAIAVGQFSDVA